MGKLSKLVLLSSGAALAWFLDPVSGSDRRRQLTDRVTALTGGADPVRDLTGGADPVRDPTGGAAPPPLASVQPMPTPDAALAQAVEAAAGGEKVLRAPDRGEDDADLSRAGLRPTL